MARRSENITSPTSRPQSSHPSPDMYDELGLNTDPVVYEAEEETHSSILGPDGEPLRYRSKKLGYIGFTPLKERP